MNVFKYGPESNPSRNDSYISDRNIEIVVWNDFRNSVDIHIIIEREKLIDRLSKELGVGCVIIDMKIEQLLHSRFPDLYDTHLKLIYNLDEEVLLESRILDDFLTETELMNLIIAL